MGGRELSAPGEGSAFWGVRGISTTGRTQHLAGWEVLAPERAQLLGGRGREGGSFFIKDGAAKGRVHAK